MPWVTNKAIVLNCNVDMIPTLKDNNLTPRAEQCLLIT